MSSTPTEAKSLRELSPTQWRSGIAAWLGWMFDGLDMHLYTVVGAGFVALLLGSGTLESDPRVKSCAGYIQAAFLVGWALGGGFFGRIGDRIGRSRTLALTILTYACFTGFTAFAFEWWHLIFLRFIAALGIGGEWAVGASLLSETWPKRWRPWLAAVLQSGVNIGVLSAMLLVLPMSSLHPRYVFLIGVLPAFLVFWIRKSVPETDEWHAAKASATAHPSIADLFRGDVRRVTVLTILVCSLSLTGHWAFMFWQTQHVRSLIPEGPNAGAARTTAANLSLIILMLSSIAGNFFAAWVARYWGYRRSIALLCVTYFAALVALYGWKRDVDGIFWLLPFAGFSQGIFALFTMYLPPLFPTLLRTTGAGFCYNIGRIAAAAGTAILGMGIVSVDYRTSLIAAGTLFLPAAAVAFLMPEPADEKA